MIRLVIISDYTKFLQVVWKRLYGKSSRDHGTLNYFRALLNRRTVTSNPKKAVDANIEFIITVVKGHLLAYACELLGIPLMNMSSCHKEFAMLQLNVSGATSVSWQVRL